MFPEIAEEGGEKSIRFPRLDFCVAPFIVIWEVTFACDLACRHCRASAEPQRDVMELTTEEAKKLLEDVAQFGRPLFILTGGDPFKRPDLFEIISYGISLKLPVSVSPSVTPLFTDDKIEKMKKVGVKAVSISLDGADEETHDSFRGIPGIFRRTLDIWEKLKKAGIKVQVNTTVSRINIERLAEIFSLVARMGAMTWSVFFLVETGRAEEKSGAELQISPEEFEDVMNFLYDAAEYIPLKTTEGHHYKRVFMQRKAFEERGLDFMEYMHVGELYHRLKEKLDSEVKKYGFKKKERRTPMNVNAGRGFIFISKRGDVFPSGFLPVKVGSVREKSIVEIYREAEVLKRLRDYSNLKGKCGICEFREVCGGSRSRAYAHTGDMFAEEPFCIYQPSSSGTFL